MPAPYRRVRPIEWRRAPDRVELRDGDAWVALSPWTAPILEAIDREAPLVEIVEAMEGRSRGEGRALRFLFNLHRMGYVELPAPPMPELLLERYERDKELGRGGVGVAWRYRDRARGGAPVVVKRAWDLLQPYEVTEAAMRREAEVMRALDHPRIARAYDATEVDGHLHLVREYVDGTDLLAFAGSGVADARERRRIVAGVAEALQHLHERGYLLIDLRPANFLLRGPAREPVLLDVGQCRPHQGGALEFRRRLGSPGFMSPEMEAEKRVDVRSDVWGLGRLLFFLGTGQMPAREHAQEALLERAPAEDRPLLARLCADDPAARPASAQAARALLGDT